MSVSSIPVSNCRVFTDTRVEAPVFTHSFMFIILQNVHQYYTAHFTFLTSLPYLTSFSSLPPLLPPPSPSLQPHRSPSVPHNTILTIHTVPPHPPAPHLSLPSPLITQKTPLSSPFSPPHYPLSSVVVGQSTHWLLVPHSHSHSW